jgi:hypothetical protein
LTASFLWVENRTETVCLTPVFVHKVFFAEKMMLFTKRIVLKAPERVSFSILFYSFIPILIKGI